MKKKFLVVLTILSILSIALIAFNRLSGQQFNPNNDTREVKISWSEVNLRISPSINENVIGTLHNGETVILTGYFYEYLGGNGKATDSWVEVITQDKTHGWVVTQSIDWQP